MTTYQKHVADELRKVAALIDQIGVTKAGPFDSFFGGHHAITQDDVVLVLERVIGAAKHPDFAKTEEELQAGRDALADREVEDCIFHEGSK